MMLLRWSAVVGMLAPIAAQAAYLAPRSEGRPERLAAPAASQGEGCSAACDRQAGDCVDDCEEKFREDRPRVECKVKCIEARHRCEERCR